MNPTERRRLLALFPDLIFPACHVRVDVSAEIDDIHSQYYQKIQELILNNSPEDVGEINKMVIKKLPTGRTEDVRSMKEFLHPLIIEDQQILTGVFDFLMESPFGILYPKYATYFTQIDGRTYLAAIPIGENTKKTMALTMEQATMIYSAFSNRCIAMNVQDFVPAPPFSYKQEHLFTFVSPIVDPSDVRGQDNIFWGASVHTKKYNVVVSCGEIKTTKPGRPCNAVMIRHSGSARERKRMKKQTFYLQNNTEFQLPHLVMYTFSTPAAVGEEPIKWQSHGRCKRYVRPNAGVKKVIGESVLTKETILQVTIANEDYSAHQVKRIRQEAKKKYFRLPTSDEDILGASKQGVSIQQLNYTENTPEGPKVYTGTAIVMTDMLKVFLKACPSGGEIKAWREKLKASAPKGLNGILQELSRKADKSGIDPDWGGNVVYDTTFDLANLYLSTLVGDIPAFVNESGKRTFLPLAFLVHSHKCGSLHRHLFSVVSQMCLQIDNKKRCFSFTSDAEAAFVGHKKAPFFDHACHMLCNLHFLGNLTGCKTRIAELKTILFGHTTPEGYKRGALMSCSSGEIKKNLQKLYIDSKLTLEEFNKITSNKRLVSSHSLATLMRCRRSLPFATSNLVENFNKILKDAIGGHTRTAAQLTSDVIAYAKSMYRQLQQAANSQNGCRVSLKNQSEVANYDESQRMELFHSLGLHPPSPDVNFERPIPEELFQGLASKERRILIGRVTALTVKALADQSGAVLMNEGKYVGTVNVSNNFRLTCQAFSSFICDRKACDHKLAFLQSLHDDMRQHCIEALLLELNPRDNIVRPKSNNQGKKPRKMNGKHGAGNHSRTIRNHLPIEENYISDDEEPWVIMDEAEMSEGSIDLEDAGGLVELPDESNRRLRKSNSRLDGATYDLS